MKYFKLFLLLTLPVLWQSCTSTQIVASWHDENTQPRQFKKILVIGMSQDVAARATVEDEVVYFLNLKGIPAVSASSLLAPERKILKASPEVQKQKLNEEGIDGVLAISLLRTEDKTRYVQGNTYDPVGYYGGYYGSFYTYYPQVYGTVYQPGYYVNTKDVYLETNLYDVATGKLLWSAQSETMDPQSIDELANSFARGLVSHLLKRKIIVPTVTK